MLLDSASRFIPGIVLFVAGTSKLIQLSWFAARVDGYALLPRRTALAAALLIVVSELAFGGLLLLGLLPAFSTIGAICLFLIFTAGMVINLLRNRTDLECGCLRRGHKVNWGAVCRNLAMVTLLLLPLQRSTWSSTIIVWSFGVSLAVIVLAVALDLDAQRGVKKASVAAWVVQSASEAELVNVRDWLSGRSTSSVTGMSNVLDDTKQQQILALGRLGAALRRIEPWSTSRLRWRAAVIRM
jgi:hypothetical protein